MKKPIAVSGSNGSIEEIMASPEEQLGHELIHVDQFIREGVADNAEKTHVFSMGGMSYEERERVSELRAVGLGGYNKPGDITENMIRRELGVRPRATYNLPSSSRNIRQVK